jgi:hypothetical protein
MEILGFFTGIFVGIWAMPFLTATVILIGLAFALAYEKGGWSTGALAIIVAGTVWSFWGQVSGWTIALWAGSYIGIGILMTYPLYNSYSRRKSRNWKDMLQDFQKDKEPSWLDKNGFLKGWYGTNLPDLVRDTLNNWYYVTVEDVEKVATPELKQQAQTNWRQKYQHSLVNQWNSTNVILQVAGPNADGIWPVTHIKKYLVGQMALWMFYWPPYTLVMVFRDVVRNFWEFIVEQFGGHLARMSTGHFNAA